MNFTTDILNLSSIKLFIAKFFRYISKTYKERTQLNICKNYKDGQFIGDCDT